MANKLHYITAILAIATIFSCKKESLDLVERSSFEPTSSYNIEDTCGAVTTTLYAGQNINVGSVTYANTETDLLVIIQTENNWLFGQSHIFAGSYNDLPLAGNNNPQIGLFPYQTTHNPMVNEYVYSIPLDQLDACFIVAVHLELHLIDENGDTIQSETGWAEGENFTQQGSWGGYLDYCVESCCEIDSSTYTIYGGQTIEVGTLVVTNDDDNLYVTWTLDGCWTLEETHLYVGDAANIPTNSQNTPVPGQFPYSETHNNITTYTYTIPLADLPACYAIAAHASVLCDGVEQETAWSDGTAFPDTNRWGWYSEYCTQTCN